MIEIKKDEDITAAADLQMWRYMGALKASRSRERNLQGFLVMGRKVRVYELHSPKHGTMLTRVTLEFDMFDEDNSLISRLCEIAVKNWNRSL